MKVRFGVGLGARTAAGELAGIVDRLEGEGVDSLWLSELVYSAAVDPIVGMAFALGRTSRLKVGTSVAILPGRHPVLVAKQLASLAAVAPGRVLPAFGLSPAQTGERELFPVPTGERGAVFDESLRLLRAVLDGDGGSGVDFEGKYFAVHDAGFGLRPARPLDVWIGGASPAAFRRVGRLADGWLGSFLTPAEAGRGREAIQAAAAEAGREVEEDHFGISVFVAEDGIPPELAAVTARRRPDLDPDQLIAGSWADLHRLLDGYIEAGLSKFVIGSVGARPYDEFLDGFVAELLPRQN